MKLSCVFSNSHIPQLNSLSNDDTIALPMTYLIELLLHDEHDCDGVLQDSTTITKNPMCLHILKHKIIFPKSRITIQSFSYLANW